MSKDSVQKGNEEGKETDPLTVTEPSPGEEMVTDSNFGANSITTIERDENDVLKDSDAGFKESTTSDKCQSTTTDGIISDKCQSTPTTLVTQKLYSVKNPLPSRSPPIASAMGFTTIQAAVPSPPAPSQPGSIPSQPGSIPSQPGSAPTQPGSVLSQPGNPSTSGRVEPQSVLIFFKQKQCEKEYAERKEKILRLLPNDLQVSTLQQLDSKLAEIKSTGVSGGNIGPFKRMVIVPKDDSLAYCIPVMVHSEVGVIHSPRDVPVNGTNETMSSPVLLPDPNQMLGESSNQMLGDPSNQMLGESSNQMLGESSNQMLGDPSNPEETSLDERVILKRDLDTYGLTISYTGAHGLFKSRLPRGIPKPVPLPYSEDTPAHALNCAETLGSFYPPKAKAKTAPKAKPKTARKRSCSKEMSVEEMKRFMTSPQVRVDPRSSRKCAFSFCPCSDIPVPGHSHRLCQCDIYAESWMEQLSKLDPEGRGGRREQLAKLDPEGRGKRKGRSPVICTCHFPRGEPEKDIVLTPSDYEMCIDRLRKEKRIQDAALAKFMTGIRNILSEDQLARIYEPSTYITMWSDEAMFKALKILKIVAGKKYKSIMNILGLPMPSLQAIRHMVQQYRKGKARGGEKSGALKEVVEFYGKGPNPDQGSAARGESSSAADILGSIADGGHGSILTHSAENKSENAGQSSNSVDAGQSSSIPVNPNRVHTTTITVAEGTSTESESDEEDSTVGKKKRRKRGDIPGRKQKNSSRSWPVKGLNVPITPPEPVDQGELSKAIQDYVQATSQRKEEQLRKSILPPPSRLKKLKGYRDALKKMEADGKDTSKVTLNQLANYGFIVTPKPITPTAMCTKGDSSNVATPKAGSSKVNAPKGRSSKVTTPKDGSPKDGSPKVTTPKASKRKERKSDGNMVDSGSCSPSKVSRMETASAVSSIRDRPQRMITRGCKKDEHQMLDFDYLVKSFEMYSD